MTAVEFLIDGKVRWVEHNPPYTYANDENGHHLGFLVPTWLRAGKHTFTVRATDVKGRTASDSIVARVLPAPAPPAALAGSWARTIDTTGAPSPGSAENPTNSITPSGTRYTMTFTPQWIRERQPGTYTYPASNQSGSGFVYLNDYTAGPRTFHVDGPVVFHPIRPNDKGAENSEPWCYPDGPPADYRWSVSGTTLTLAPVGGKDACGIRGFIWTGQWRRVG